MFLFVSCNSESHSKNEVSTLIITSPLQQDTIINKEYVCQIHSFQHIELRALERGYLKSVYVDEGQFVKQGDTILFISETKEEYLDPNLVENTEQQLKSKEFSVKSYMEKIKANDNQIDAMISARKLKLEAFTPETLSPISGRRHFAVLN